MLTVSDLGKAVKAKNPGVYDALTDEEAGRATKLKYPGKYDNFTDVALAPANSSSVEYIPPPSTVLSTPQYSYTHPEPITAGETQSVYRLLSIGLWIACVLLIATACSASNGANIWAHIILGVGAGVAASGFGRKANEAYETEKRETGYAVEIKSNQIALRANEEREKQIEEEAQRALELQRMRQETAAREELARQQEIEAKKKEQALRERLIEEGIKKGIPPEAVASLNEHELRTKIDSQNRWVEIVQDLDAADLLEISEQQLLKKLRGNLNELYRERYQIEEGDDPPVVREKILARYDKDAGYLEGLIDARQAGHFLQEDKEKVRRLAEGTPDGGAGYPAAIDSDDQ